MTSTLHVPVLSGNAGAPFTPFESYHIKDSALYIFVYLSEYRPRSKQAPAHLPQFGRNWPGTAECCKGGRCCSPCCVLVPWSVHVQLQTSSCACSTLGSFSMARMNCGHSPSTLPVIRRAGWHLQTCVKERFSSLRSIVLCTHHSQIMA